MTYSEHSQMVNDLFLELFNESQPKKGSVHITTDGQIGDRFLREEITDFRTAINKYYDLNVNLSSILSFLIGEAGRWCESYASDLMITWDTVRSALVDMTTDENEPSERVIMFGFRQLGVDSNQFVYSRLSAKEYISPLDYYYRGKVYGLKISLNEDRRYFTVEFKDMRDVLQSACYHDRFVRTEETERNT